MKVGGVNINLPLPYLYIFLDEGGNFDFSPKGTKYFTLTALTITRPFGWDADLMALKYDELERGMDAENFHATEDKQVVRDRVFTVIQAHLGMARLDTIVVPKNKVVPALQPEERFYPRILGYLLRYVVVHEPVEQFREVIVMSDAVPVKAKQRAIAKAVGATLAAMLPTDVRYRVLHHESKSCASLQVVDYCNWAIYRKWDRGDTRSYALIQRALRSEFEIFTRSKKVYY